MAGSTRKPDVRLVSGQGTDGHADMVARAVTKRICGVSFRVARAEDIVVMKALALRPRDVADIEGILDAVPDLALDAVRRDLRMLSESLEGPDFLSELERIVSLHRRGAGSKVRAKKSMKPRHAR